MSKSIDFGRLAVAFVKMYSAQINMEPPKGVQIPKEGWPSGFHVDQESEGRRQSSLILVSCEFLLMSEKPSSRIYCAWVRGMRSIGQMKQEPNKPSLEKPPVGFQVLGLLLNLQRQSGTPLGWWIIFKILGPGINWFAVSQTLGHFPPRSNPRHCSLFFASDIHYSRASQKDWHMHHLDSLAFSSLATRRMATEGFWGPPLKGFWRTRQVATEDLGGFKGKPTGNQTGGPVWEGGFVNKRNLFFHGQEGLNLRLEILIFRTLQMINGEEAGDWIGGDFFLIEQVASCFLIHLRWVSLG